ncbi:hypothetical protein FA132_30265, partial [Pseudomonas aeruginosa]|nr:hypothetical protein [Pseudomonas aeruginosa]
GRISVESVVRCSWNGWPDDRGIRMEAAAKDDEERWRGAGKTPKRRGGRHRQQVSREGARGRRSSDARGRPDGKWGEVMP